LLKKQKYASFIWLNNGRLAQLVEHLIDVERVTDSSSVPPTNCMKILSIETSCDETAISLVEAKGDLNSPTFSVLGNGLYSQIDIHKEYGGVFPMLAKREHAKNLTPILEKVLKESNLISNSQFSISKQFTNEIWNEVEKILEREKGLFEPFKNFLEKIEKPNIDVISVTSGPGLAPALWVGISFAKALSLLWDIPVIGVNHMEGHVASILIENDDKRKVEFPALALLISGGHTELVNISAWGNYAVIGKTRDDAVGEAFDKTARLLDLPYPGGPEISKLAEVARESNLPKTAYFPRPMINTNDIDFSFSGLKTAVLYYIRDNFGEKALTKNDKADIAREFEDTVIEILLKKTEKAIVETGAKTLIIGGGVIANKRIKEFFGKLEDKYSGLIVKTPTRSLSTDNSLMIAAATYINILVNPEIIHSAKEIIAEGNLKLGTNSL
jgi:N6-L-threonylcarbamoyladenine synthase